MNIRLTYQFHPWLWIQRSYSYYQLCSKTIMRCLLLPVLGSMNSTLSTIFVFVNRLGTIPAFRMTKWSVRHRVFNVTIARCASCCPLARFTFLMALFTTSNGPTNIKDQGSEKFPIPTGLNFIGCRPRTATSQSGGLIRLQGISAQFGVSLVRSDTGVHREFTGGPGKK